MRISNFQCMNFLPFETMKNVLCIYIFIFFSLCASSCTTKNESHYVARGEKIKHQLIAELRGADTLHDLFARQESLTLLFDELSKVAIEAKTFQLKTKKTWEVPPEASQSSQVLTEELGRVLKIPGARAFLEKCQAKGFERIDAFEKTRVH